MARGKWMAVLAAVGLSVWTRPAGAQGELMLYDGNLATAAGGLALSRWGSGSAEQVTDVTYVGPGVILLSTHGFYAGGVLKFAKPVDLGGFASQQDAYLEMRIRPYFEREIAQEQPKGATPAATAAPVVAPPSGDDWVEDLDRQEGRGEGPVTQVVTPTRQPTVPTVRKLALVLDHFRVVIKTEKGYAVLPWWPAPAKPESAPFKDERGWTRVSFPLRGFLGEVGSRVEEIAIFGNKPDRFYVGRLTAVTDPTPMQVTVRAYPTQGEVGEKFVFIAEVAQGLADPEVHWDLEMDFLMAPDDPNYAREFDAKFETDARGLRISNIFTQPGSHVVGYKVVDRGGAKPPVRRTLAVKVTEPKEMEAAPAY